MSRLGTALTDRYRIERELGVGGMATVYLADDLRHDRKVALGQAARIMPPVLPSGGIFRVPFLTPGHAY